MIHKLRALCVTVGVVAFLGSLACWAAQKPGPLTYRLEVSPGDITLLPKPTDGSSPAHQEETIAFTVLNTSDTDYEGTAPTCQVFDVDISWIGPTGDRLVWRWSQGRMFCQMVTPVVIPAGLNWHQSVKWNSAPAEMPPGKYRIDATFIPSNAVASAGFEIHAAH